MGMYDEFNFTCPACGKLHEEQTKAGPRIMKTYTVRDCHPAVAQEMMHQEFECSCGKTLKIVGKVTVEMEVVVKP